MILVVSSIPAPATRTIILISRRPTVEAIIGQHPTHQYQCILNPGRHPQGQARAHPSLRQ